MNEPKFPYDVFRRRSAKDKAVVRTLAERLRQDTPELQPSAFCLLPSSFPLRLDDAPIKVSLVQFPGPKRTWIVINCSRWN